MLMWDKICRKRMTVTDAKNEEEINNTTHQARRNKQHNTPKHRSLFSFSFSGPSSVRLLDRPPSRARLQRKVSYHQTLSSYSAGDAENPSPFKLQLPHDECFTDALLDTLLLQAAARPANEGRKKKQSFAFFSQLHARRVDSSTLVFSLSSHRYPYIVFVFSARFNDS